MSFHDFSISRAFQLGNSEEFPSSFNPQKNFPPPPAFTMVNNSDPFLTLKEIIVRLQDHAAILKASSSKQQLNELLDSLLLARKTTNLLLLGDSDTISSCHKTIRDLNGVLKRAKVTAPVDNQNSPSVKWNQLLVEEREMIRKKWTENVPNSHTPFSWYGVDSPKEVPNSHTSFSWFSPPPSTSQKNMGLLLSIVTSVRETEATKTFVKFLLKDSIAQANESYTLDNFAYGTTPYQSYVSIRNCPPVNRALASCRQDSSSNVSSRFAIFGSSIGLFSFFASLTDNVQTVNYEILPFLYSKAEKLRKQHKIDEQLVKFVNDDMLNCNLENVQLVMLMSMCWDATLCGALDKKIEEEMKTGSVVIDYTDRLSKSNSFALRSALTVACSWNQNQHIYVFEKVDRDDWVVVDNDNA